MFCTFWSITPPCATGGAALSAIVDGDSMWLWLGSEERAIRWYLDNANLYPLYWCAVPGNATIWCSTRFLATSLVRLAKPSTIVIKKHNVCLKCFVLVKTQTIRPNWQTLKLLLSQLLQQFWSYSPTILEGFHWRMVDRSDWSTVLIESTEKQIP
jgi:hypothetical protein